jgi:hypothetical protein
MQDSPEAFEKLDKSRVGVLVGTGMGGLQVPFTAALTDRSNDHLDQQSGKPACIAHVAERFPLCDQQVFQDGVQNLVEKGHRKISPFFIPFAITNM